MAPIPASSSPRHDAGPMIQSRSHGRRETTVAAITRAIGVAISISSPPPSASLPCL